MCQGKQGGFHERKYFLIIFSKEMRIIFPASAKKRNFGNMTWLLLPSQVAFASIKIVLIAGRFHYWWLCSARGTLYCPEVHIRVIKHQEHSMLSPLHMPLSCFCLPANPPQKFLVLRLVSSSTWSESFLTEHIGLLPGLVKSFYQLVIVEGKIGSAHIG